MIKARDFMLLQDAERKIEMGKPLTKAEQKVVKVHGITPKPLCGCGCGEKLEPRVDGIRHRLGGKEVNSGCYYDKWGTEIENYPIGGHRIRRG